jgi:hypothetical protein
LLLTPTFIENEALPFIETAKARKSRGSWANSFSWLDLGILPCHGISQNDRKKLQTADEECDEIRRDAN